MLVPLLQSSNSQSAPTPNSHVAQPSEKKKRIEAKSKAKSENNSPFTKLTQDLFMHMVAFLGDYKSIVSLHKCSKYTQTGVNRFHQLTATIHIPVDHSAMGRKLGFVKHGWWSNLKVLSIDIPSKIPLTTETEKKKLVPLIQRNKNTLTSIEFFGTQKVRSKCITDISLKALGQCNKLESCNFDFFKKISVEALRSFFNDGKRLKEVVIPEGFKKDHLNIIGQNSFNLEKVFFDDCEGLSASGLIEFAKKAKNLRHVKFRGEISTDVLDAYKLHCEMIKSMEINSIGLSMGADLLSHLPPSLVTLDFNEGLCLLDDICEPIILDNLSHLTIKIQSKIDKDRLIAICKSVPKLKYLSFTCVSPSGLENSEDEIMEAIKDLPLLEYLEIEAQAFSDKFLDEIPKRFLSLRFLTLNCETSKFTKDGLEKLSQEAKQLKCLAINSLYIKNLVLIDGFKVSAGNMRKIFPNLKAIRTKRSDPYFPQFALKECGFPIVE